MGNLLKHLKRTKGFLLPRTYEDVCLPLLPLTRNKVNFCCQSQILFTSKYQPHPCLSLCPPSLPTFSLSISHSPGLPQAHYIAMGDFELLTLIPPHGIMSMYYYNQFYEVLRIEPKVMLGKLSTNLAISLSPKQIFSCSSSHKSKNRGTSLHREKQINKPKIWRGLKSCDI